ncbi:MAG: DUF3473 domain-containing protein, partial [Deltaproteobacteria bacterium]|nr:DUF3473 domain-containing protein [Deltaproteobacteria bacterium]
RPFVIYFHPWETYPETPRLEALGAKESFITYHGIDGCLGKIESLLKDFSFDTMWNVIRRRTE